ncbi:hypothetical protein LXM94_25625 [Rhizobium sp. TRM95111]|uniref:hypothetical protein n=1 Tax=Rhizobium alarense TaxID=2846851 RepID=UPI001F2A8064|nr:hypothetical protein [Rhizobium alarense]MCF3643337.1 hypothetical protein [Rhizobium alarense]
MKDANTAAPLTNAEQEQAYVNLKAELNKVKKWDFLAACGSAAVMIYLVLPFFNDVLVVWNEPWRLVAFVILSSATFVFIRGYQRTVDVLNSLEAAELESTTTQSASNANEPLMSSGHQFVLETRYALEAAADLLSLVTTSLDYLPHEGPAGDVRAIAHALPYLWSGYRDDDPFVEDPAYADRQHARAGEIAGRHGVELSQDRRLAAVQIVRLAHNLIWKDGLGRPVHRREP